MLALHVHLSPASPPYHTLLCRGPVSYMGIFLAGIPVTRTPSSNFCWYDGDWESKKCVLLNQTKCLPNSSDF
jgi:hypothetical protein